MSPRASRDLSGIAAFSCGRFDPGRAHDLQGQPVDVFLVEVPGAAEGHVEERQQGWGKERPERRGDAGGLGRTAGRLGPGGHESVAGRAQMSKKLNQWVGLADERLGAHPGRQRVAFASRPDVQRIHHDDPVLVIRVENAEGRHDGHAHGGGQQERPQRKGREVAEERHERVTASAQRRSPCRATTSPRRSAATSVSETVGRERVTK